MGVQKIKIELLYDTGILYLDINCNLCSFIKQLFGLLLKMTVTTSSCRSIDLLPVALGDSWKLQGEIKQWRVSLQSSHVSRRTQKGWVSWDYTCKQMSHEIGNEDGRMKDLRAINKVGVTAVATMAGRETCHCWVWLVRSLAKSLGPVGLTHRIKQLLLQLVLLLFLISAQGLQ